MAYVDMNLKDRITALIPAAGRVPSEPMQADGPACPAMIPVGGRPVVYWTLRYLYELGIRKFFIAVAERGLYVERYVHYVVPQDCDIQFIRPTVNAGLGRTVQELADCVQTESSLVVLGDTYFRFADPEVLQSNQPTVLTHTVDEPFRWCTVDVDSHGFVNALHDKDSKQSEPYAALIGVYYFPSTLELQKDAKLAVAENPQSTELSAILRKIGSRSPLRTVIAGAWQDCGNPDLQTGSHQKLLESRAFQ